MRRESYSDFSQRIFRASTRERWPLCATIELTHRCPFACAHCLNRQPLGAAARGGELGLEDHRRILDELAQLGCLWLLFTGGEVLARPDFLDIYLYAKQKGFLVTIFTNAALVTEEIADSLARARPFSVEVSLYGHSDAVFDRVTGVAGSRQRCLRGLRLLQEKGVPVRTKAMAL